MRSYCFIDKLAVSGYLMPPPPQKKKNSQHTTEFLIHKLITFQVQFEKDARTRYLQLLGYDQTDLSKKVAEVTGSNSLKEKAGVGADELADKMSMLNAVSSK